MQNKENQPRKYKPGDIFHVLQNPNDKGIVLSVSAEIIASNKKFQLLNCLFSKEEDIYRKVKELSTQKILRDITHVKEHHLKYVDTIESYKIKYIESKPEWIKPITTKEIGTYRFKLLIDDLFRS